VYTKATTLGMYCSKSAKNHCLQC